MKAKQLTSAEERLLDKIADKVWEEFEENINEVIRAKRRMENHEPYVDFSYFLQIKNNITFIAGKLSYITFSRL
jgi:flagellar motor switch protein FliM